jgi:hypothetical protein
VRARGTAGSRAARGCRRLLVELSCEQLQLATRAVAMAASQQVAGALRCTLRRYHSRLQNVEFDAWVVADKLPEAAKKDPESHTNVYFWRHAFNPCTLERVAAAAP